jgi:hypothetical protein
MNMRLAPHWQVTDQTVSILHNRVVEACRGNEMDGAFVRAAVQRAKESEVVRQCALEAGKAVNNQEFYANFGEMQRRFISNEISIEDFKTDIINFGLVREPERFDEVLKVALSANDVKLQGSNDGCAFLMVKDQALLITAIPWAKDITQETLNEGVLSAVTLASELKVSLALQGI